MEIGDSHLWCTLKLAKFNPHPPSQFSENLLSTWRSCLKNVSTANERWPFLRLSCLFKQTSSSSCNWPVSPVLSFEPATMHFCPRGCQVGFQISLVCISFSFYDKKLKQTLCWTKQENCGACCPWTEDSRGTFTVRWTHSHIHAGWGGWDIAVRIHACTSCEAEKRQHGCPHPLLSFPSTLLVGEKLFGNTVLTSQRLH